MSIAVEGIYKEGRIELQEIPHDVHDNTRVIVTFVDSSDINLAERGISREVAAKIRLQLAPFAEIWDDPEMDDYNDYDAAKQRD